MRDDENATTEDLLGPATRDLKEAAITVGDSGRVTNRLHRLGTLPDVVAASADLEECP